MTTNPARACNSSFVLSHSLVIRHSSFVISMLATFVAMLAASVSAAAPTINSISLRGLQIGATTTIAIDGNDLMPEPRLMLPVAIAKQSIRSGATPQHVEFEVALGD